MTITTMIIVYAAASFIVILNFYSSIPHDLSWKTAIPYIIILFFIAYMILLSYVMFVKMPLFPRESTDNYKGSISKSE
jgi:hypothetical protein